LQTPPEISAFPILEKRQKVVAGKLSGGEQQIVALAKVLVLKPKLLLLDEPLHGLSPAWVSPILNRIMELSKDEVAVILVEQNVNEALSIANRGCVVISGRVARKGEAEDLVAESKAVWGFNKDAAREHRTPEQLARAD